MELEFFEYIIDVYAGPGEPRDSRINVASWCQKMFVLTPTAAVVADRESMDRGSRHRSLLVISPHARFHRNFERWRHGAYFYLV